MTPEQALKILAETAVLAQSKGILSLDDAVIVRDAILTFKKNEDQPAEKETVEVVSEKEDEKYEDID